MSAITFVLATLFVSYVSSQEYWIYEQVVPLRHLQDEHEHDDDVTHRTTTTTTTTTQRVCVVKDPETGELSTRPIEDCRQNNAEEIPPPAEGEEPKPPVSPPDTT